MKKQISILVPIYKKNLEKLEIKILERISNLYFGKHDLFFLLPSDSKLNYKNLGFQNIYFDKSNFLDVHNFNKFCVSTELYKNFLDYEYMLFHQLDAIILSNNLENWIKKNYSYIGGPSFHKSLFKKNPIKPKFFCNGGLSLRKVKDFINVLESEKIFLKKIDSFTIKEILKRKYIYRYLKLFFTNYKNNNYFNVNAFIENFFLSEDVFWTHFAKLFNVNFNLPKDAIECANFSLNEGHKFYIQKFNIKPFGAHYYNKENFKFLNELFLENKIVSKEEIANLNY